MHVYIIVLVHINLTKCQLAVASLRNTLTIIERNIDPDLGPMWPKKWAHTWAHMWFIFGPMKTSHGRHDGTMRGTMIVPLRDPTWSPDWAHYGPIFGPSRTRAQMRHIFMFPCCSVINISVMGP